MAHCEASFRTADGRTLRLFLSYVYLLSGGLHLHVSYWGRAASNIHHHEPVLAMCTWMGIVDGSCPPLP